MPPWVHRVTPFQYLLFVVSAIAILMIGIFFYDDIVSFIILRP